MAAFDLNAFKAFCEAKPRDEVYNGNSYQKCALGQFGYPNLDRWNCDAIGVPLPVYEATGYHGKSTFGALLDRLNALEAEKV